MNENRNVCAEKSAFYNFGRRQNCESDARRTCLVHSFIDVGLLSVRCSCRSADANVHSFGLSMSRPVYFGLRYVHYIIFIASQWLAAGNYCQLP